MLYETRILRKIMNMSGDRLSISFDADGNGSVKIDSHGQVPEFQPFHGLNDLHKFLDLYLEELTDKPKINPTTDNKQGD